MILIVAYLIFASKQLGGGRTLSDYSSPIDLGLCGGMQISVKTHTSKAIALEVESSDTIDNTTPNSS